MAMLAGLARPQSGMVRTEGVTPGAISYLPQATAIECDYPVSALEFAALGRWREFGAFGTPSYGLLPEVMAALQTVGLQDKATAPIAELSVGQFRRLLFARLIVQQARLVLLDEPFAAIDAQTTDDLLAVLRGWHAAGCTVVAVLHDIGQVRDTLPNALLLNRRVVAWDATAAALTPDSLAAAGMGGRPAGPAGRPAPPGARLMRALLLEPFWSYSFMRTALVACLGLALANAPVGVLLLQRRMSLTAGVLSHAVMPGAALGFLVAGYSVLALSLRGVAAGVLVALLASAAARLHAEGSEAPLAVMYLMSLAAGVLLMSLRGSNLDLMHVLFGTVLAVDARALAFIALVATITLLVLAAIWRPLAVEGFDPLFLRSARGARCSAACSCCSSCCAS